MTFGEKNNPEFGVQSVERNETKNYGSPERKASNLDTRDNSANFNSEDSTGKPYQVGVEYGYPVIFYPKTNQYILQIQLPRIFYDEQHKTDFVRKYPNYSLIFVLSSLMLVRKTPFIPIPPNQHAI